MKYHFFIFVSVYFIFPIKDLRALVLEQARVMAPNEGNMVLVMPNEDVAAAVVSKPAVISTPFYEEPIIIAVGIFVILTALFLVFLKLRK